MIIPYGHLALILYLSYTWTGSMVILTLRIRQISESNCFLCHTERSHCSFVCVWQGHVDVQVYVLDTLVPTVKNHGI